MNRHGIQLAQKAREYGVSREDFTRYIGNEEKLKKLFAEMDISTTAWFEDLKARTEKIGARVHMMVIDVDYSKPHKEAAMTGGPQAPSSPSVLEVADEYVLLEKGIVRETVILLNWPNGDGSYAKAVRWGLKNHLRKTTPHVLFAVGALHPRLNCELGQNPMCMAETTGCTLNGQANACYVWWRDEGRKTDLSWLDFFGDAGDWFAFRR